MNIRTAFNVIKADMIAGNAALLSGPPGTAKSSLTEKLAQWWAKHIWAIDPNAKVGYSRFFMATQTTVGFTGLPWKGEKSWTDTKGVTHKYTMTDPAVPQWYMAIDMRTGEIRPADTFDSVFLIIEEWGQGSLEAKRAGAEVLLAGGTPPFYLPNGRFPSPRLACSNVDARDGVTKEFDFIIGRRAERRITGDVTIWLEDFADKPYTLAGREWHIMSATKVWAKQHPEILYEDKPKVQGPWCNQRSLTQADRYAQVAGELNGGSMPIKDSSFMEGLEGYIGMGAAQSYVADLQFMLELPSIESVAADPEGTPVPAKVDLQMMMAYQMAGLVQPHQLSAVIRYMTKDSKPRMAQDMAVTFVSSLLRRDFKLVNNPHMAAWLAKNALLMTKVAALTQ